VEIMAERKRSDVKQKWLSVHIHHINKYNREEDVSIMEGWDGDDFLGGGGRLDGAQSELNVGDTS